MQKIINVTGIHGNETAPVLAHIVMQKKQLVGNVEALLQNKRFIEKDLNQAFGVNDGSSESLRAKELLSMIDEKDLVVDFHTTSSASPAFAIIVDLAMLPLARRLGLAKVVYMKHNIKKGHSLLNYRNGVALEAGLHGSREAFDTTLRVIEHLESGKLADVELYEVYGKIDKAGEYKNFVIHEDGFYPVLAGEKAYDFPGLKARRVY